MFTLNHVFFLVVFFKTHKKQIKFKIKHNEKNKISYYNIEWKKICVVKNGGKMFLINKMIKWKSTLIQNTIPETNAAGIFFSLRISHCQVYV